LTTGGWKGLSAYPEILLSFSGFSVIFSAVLLAFPESAEKHAIFLRKAFKGNAYSAAHAKSKQEHRNTYISIDIC